MAIAKKAAPVVRRIYELLDERKMSAKELALEVGISEQAIQKWRRGQSSPTLATRKLVARALDVPLTELLVDPEESAEDESDLAIDAYLKNFGTDMTPMQIQQLRRSIPWSDQPVTLRVVQLVAEAVRIQFPTDATPPEPLNPRGRARGRRLRR